MCGREVGGDASVSGASGESEEAAEFGARSFCGGGCGYVVHLSLGVGYYYLLVGSDDGDNVVGVW